MKIARVEKWKMKDGETEFYEWEELYFIVKEGRETIWLNENMERIDNPLEDFNQRKFNRIVNTGKNGTFEASDEWEFDIIFNERGVFESEDADKILEKLSIRA